MKRGDVVLAAASGDYGKPRPFVIVQANDTIDLSDSVVLCPITSHLTEAKLRIRLEPGAGTGLRVESEVMAEKLIALPKSKIRSVIGGLTQAELRAVNATLMMVLDLPS
ncbi:MAG: type II toxin-antitoxin system PemK/MazF family toxin [Ignavibacteriales bacterium]